MDGYIAINNGKIAKIGTGTPPPSDEIIDHSGNWLFPGVIDAQVHAYSPLGVEGINMASKSAAAGGVTVMVEMPYDAPEAISTVSAFRKKRDIVINESHVCVAMYATILDEDGLDTIPDLIAEGACGFKFSTFEAQPKRFPRVFEEVICDAMTIIGKHGLPIGVHNQMQGMTLRNMERVKSEGKNDLDAFLEVNSELVEDLATAAIYEMGARTKAKANAVHVSTGRGFDIRKMYRDAGHNNAIETCIPYLMVNHDDHAHLQAIIKHYPPMRPKREVAKLWQHIKDGNCTMVSSDHTSWPIETKNEDDFFKNKSGGPGLEALLPALWTGCEANDVSPTVAAQLLCQGPAEHFLLEDRKGALKEGLDADIVVLQPGNHTFSAKNAQAAAKWSMFEGWNFTVKVTETYLMGEKIWDGEKIVSQAGGNDKFLAPHNHKPQ